MSWMNKWRLEGVGEIGELMSLSNVLGESVRSNPHQSSNSDRRWDVLRSYSSAIDLRPLYR